MVTVNNTSKELTGKIVYYGPGLGGKTTNLEYIYQNMEDEQKGEMLSLSTDTDRTIFFDFLPLELGEIKDYKIRIQIYTVPGQVFYAKTRKRVLKGTDGVVFVADSQQTVREANKQALGELHKFLDEHRIDPDAMPIVLQYNKRDLDDILTLEELDEDLNEPNHPFFESVATEGIGVEDTLQAILKLVLKKMKKTMKEKPGKVQAVVTSSDEPSLAAPETPAREEEGPILTPETQAEIFGLEEGEEATPFEDEQEENLFEDAEEVSLLDSGGELDEDLSTSSVEDTTPGLDDSLRLRDVSMGPGQVLGLTLDFGRKRYRMTVRIEEENDG